MIFKMLDKRKTELRGGLEKRRTRSALVVMANKVSAMGSVCGDLKNPLLVMPLNKAAAVEGSSFFPPRHVEHEPYIPVVNNLVGASYPIMDKLMKAAEKQK